MELNEITKNNVKPKYINSTHPKLSKECVNSIDDSKYKYMNKFLYNIIPTERKMRQINTQSPPIKHVIIDVDIPKLELTPK